MIQMHTVDTEYDVIVVGGGPAGCAAAWAAAHHGARTLLLESSGALGGMATMGMVTCFAPFSDGEKMIYRGFAKTIFEQSRAAMAQVSPDALDWVPLSPEALKVIYDEALKEAGVEVSFFSTVVGAETDSGSITGVCVARKDGLRLCRAKVYIDCTGDANLSVFAGVPTEKGGPNGELQPASLCFIIANVNMDGMKDIDLYGNSDSSPIHEIIRSGKYPLIRESHLCVDVLADGILGFNAGHIWNSDGTDPDCVTDAITRGRLLAREYHRALRDTLPEAFGSAFLVETAPLLGVRETRRIRGKYVFTYEDYLQRRSFPDEISRNCYYIDIHTVRSAGDFTESETEAMSQYQRGESHGIPYRCLVPENVNNLLAAGRIISSDRTTNASLRVMPNCLTTGEAAGTAACLAIRHHCSPADVDTDELRALLRQNGAYFL